MASLGERGPRKFNPQRVGLFAYRGNMMGVTRVDIDADNRGSAIYATLSADQTPPTSLPAAGGFGSMVLRVDLRDSRVCVDSLKLPEVVPENQRVLAMLAAAAWRNSDLVVDLGGHARIVGELLGIPKGEVASTSTPSSEIAQLARRTLAQAGIRDIFGDRDEL